MAESSRACLASCNNRIDVNTAQGACGGEKQCPDSGGLYCKLYLLFGCYATQVDDCVAHASERGVDAYVGLLCDFLKGEIEVVSHVEHFSLEFGKFVDKVFDVVEYLVVDDEIFYCSLAEFLAVEDVDVSHVGRLEIFGFFLTVVVDYEIMRNSRYPGGEAAVFGVTSLLDCQDCLYKGLLKDIVGKILIFDYSEDVVEYAVLMPFEKCIESLVAALRISFNQLFVGHA